MKIMCSEEGLRKLAGSLVGAQFLRVTPVAESSSAPPASEYEIFAPPGAAMDDAAPEHEPAREQSRRVAESSPPQPASSQAGDGSDDDDLRPTPGALDWVAGYQRHKAAVRRRRMMRYTIVFGLLAVSTFSALVVLT